jgi:membrane protein implicated in regulation of membrane protease activity
MDLSSATWWWVAAGIAVAAELATGTFYLLMIALGLAAAAVASHLGASISAQIVTAAVLGGGATALWHGVRARQPRSMPASQNRDVNLDIGETVQVAAWSAQRTAQVHYRGSLWSARLQPGASAAGGSHVVTAVEGNWLVLAPAPNP